MPPTLITRDRIAIEAFRQEYGSIVMKPLYGNGGAGIFKVGKDDPNFGPALRHVSGGFTRALGQPALPA